MDGRMKIMLAMSVMAVALTGFVILGDESEDSDAIDTGTSSNPLTIFDIDARDAYFNYAGQTVYVIVGGTVNVWAQPYGSVGSYVEDVTSGFGLYIDSVGYPDLTGTITKSGTITVTVRDTSLQNDGPRTFTIKAVSVATTYTVSFSVSSGSSYGYISPTSVTVASGTTYSASGRTITFSDGQSVTAYVNSPPSGYTYSFGSWSSTSGTITANKSITCTFTRTSVTPTYTCYLYYNANGGNTSSLPSPNPQPYSGSSTSSHTFTISSTVPTRSGYDFLGWNTSSTATMPDKQPGDSISVRYNGSETLYAIWGQLYTYSVQASPSNAGIVTINSQSSVTLEADYPLQLFAQANTGHAFSKWTYTQNGVTNDLTTQPTYSLRSPAVNTVYTAIFDQNSFTITLDAGTNGGTINSPFNGSATETTRQVTAYVGTLYYNTSNWPGTAYKVGYTFNGWYTQATGGTQIEYDTIVPSNPPTTLYAQFTQNDYIVQTAENDSSIGSSSGGGTYHYGDSIRLVATPNLGHEFVRWTISSGGTSSEASTDQIFTFTLSYPYVAPFEAETVVFMAVFDNDYITITFNGNGGTPSENSKQINRGAAIGTLPTATRQGTVFAGWSMYLSNEGTMITPSTTFSEDTIIYALYDVTVTFNPNGGTITSGSATRAVTIGMMDYRFPTVDRVGYSLIGWFTEATGGTRVYVSTRVTETTNHTLYAQWSADVITVNFDATTNGGVLRGDSSKEVSRGDTFGALPTAVKTDYLFEGWFTHPTSGSRITSSSIVASNYSNPLTLYAQFTERVQGEVWWWNDYVNGSVEIAFNYTNLTSSAEHVMTIPLWKYNNTPPSITTDPHGLNQFDPTNYELELTVGYNTNMVMNIKEGGNQIGESYTFKIGYWPQYTILIDAQNGHIMFRGINNLMDSRTQPFSFMNYTTVMDTKAIDFSDVLTGYTIEKIYHADVGSGTGPRFQVAATTTYLNTYGFVMVDPEINIYEKFPNYDNLRLNFYSFAYYGESVTINGHTMPMTGFSQINLYYVPANTPIRDSQDQIIGYTTENTISTQSSPDAVLLTAELNNIYVTWTNIHSETLEDRVCYLTFVDNRNLTINMGTYATGDLNVSFEGVWFFTTMLYEPYNSTVKEYEMDWDSWFNLDANAFIILFMIVTVLGFVILNKFYKPGFLDYVVVIGSGVFSYLLLGGF